MKTIELTLSSSYCPSWSTWEGVRELLQNAKDAETEFSAPMDVLYDATKEQLTIKNSNAYLPHEALLFGYSTKPGKPALIGQFGEGLKIGILALVRAGHGVQVFSGAECWTPALQQSTSFQTQKVLAFEITQDNDKGAVEIEINGISPAFYAELQTRILWLNDEKKELAANTSIIFDKASAGSIYCKGIFVSSNSKFTYAYNFNDVTLDRDRKMVSGQDVCYNTALAWANAVVEEPALIDDVYRMLNHNEEDVKNLHCYSYYFANEAKESFEALFHKTYGAKSLPCADLGSAKQLEHFGIKGVVTSPSFFRFWESTIGTTKDALVNLRASTSKIWQLDELTPEERGNLEAAYFIITNSTSLDKLSVVSYKDETTMGSWKNGEIELNQNILHSLQTTVETLLHEFSHNSGGDGDFSHTRAMEVVAGEALCRLWAHCNKAL